MDTKRLGLLKKMAVSAMFLLLSAALIPQTVTAQSSSSSTKSGSVTSVNLSYPLENPLSAKSLPEAIGNATRIFIGVAGSLALLAFIWGGMLMLTSGGSEQRISKGKQILVVATIGLIIIFGSYAILQTFLKVFGLT